MAEKYITFGWYNLSNVMPYIKFVESFKTHLITTHSITSNASCTEVTFGGELSDSLEYDFQDALSAAQLELPNYVIESVPGVRCKTSSDIANNIPDGKPEDEVRRDLRPKPSLWARITNFFSW